MTDDDDDCDFGRDDDDERTPLPDFGCACENALIVDAVCWSCISYLAEQDRLAKRDPSAVRDAGKGTP